MLRVPLTRLVGLAAAVGVLAVVQPLSQQASAAPPVPAAPAFSKPIEALAGYQPQVLCEPVARPGLLRVKDLLNKTYGPRTIGIPRSGCSGTSEHHEGRALDWMINAEIASQKATADAFIGWLLKTDAYGNSYAMARRLGVMYIIWNNKMWRAYDPGRGWTTYKSCPTTGSDTTCHRDHVHISFSWDGAMARTSFYSGQVLDAGTDCRALPTSGTLSPTATNRFFVPVTPARIVDSARGVGVADRMRCRMEQGGSQRMDIQVAGAGGVPSTGASAAVLAVRVGTNAPSMVSVWPTGASKPSTIQVSAGAGLDGRALVVAPLGNGGRVSLATNAGAQWVTVDVLGYYASANGMLFTGVNPWRLGSAFALGPGQSRTLKAGGTSGMPGSGIGALSASVTTSSATASGSLRIGAAGAAVPPVDTVVYRGGVTRTASVVMPSTSNGSITVKNMSGRATVTVAFDPTGWYATAGSPYTATNGARVLDTISGLGASGAVTDGRTITFPVRGVAGVPTTARSVALQLTAVSPQAVAAATVWGSGRPLPSGRQLTTEQRGSTSQYVTVPIGSDGRLALRGTGGPTHYRASVVGWWNGTSTAGVLVAPGTTTSGSTTVSTAPAPTPAPTSPFKYSLTAAVSPTWILLPSSTTVRGAVGPASYAAGKRVVLQHYASGEWRSIASSTVARDGSYAFRTTPPTRGTHQYRVWKPSDGCSSSGCVARGTVTAAVKMMAAQGYSVGIGLSASSIRLGQVATITGSVSPTIAGSGILVQRYRSGQWVTIGTATIRTSGRYSYAVTPSTRGSYVFRTVKPSAECTPLGCALRVSGSRSITLTVG